MPRFIIANSLAAIIACECLRQAHGTNDDVGAGQQRMEGNGLAKLLDEDRPLKHIRVSGQDTHSEDMDCSFTKVGL